MKNKKYIILGISLIVVGILTCVFLFTDIGTSKKLKGDVTNSNYGLTLSCTKTSLDLNESATCSVVANTDSYRIVSFQGLLTSSSNVTISNIQMGTGWQAQDATSPELIYYREGSFEAGNVGIVSFTITGTSAGSGYVKVGKQNEEIFMAYDDGNFGTILDLEEQTENIVVEQSSTPVYSNDANLKNLYVDETDVLSTLTYYVENNVTSVTVNPVPNHSGASVSGGGIVQLVEGANTVNLLVTAEDQTTTKPYVLTITRGAAPQVQDDYLTSLSITPGTLNEQFSSSTFNYTATVPNEVTSVTVSAESGLTTSNISGTGSHDLVVGENYIDVIITSPDNLSHTYSITVTRSEPDTPVDPDLSNDASVRSITVDDATVSLDTLAITVEYLNNDFVEVAVIPNDSNATVTGDVGSIPLQVGENRLNITVTAEDGTTTNTFELVITRKSADPDDPDDPTPIDPDDPTPVDPDDPTPVDPDEPTQCILTSSVYTIDNTKLRVSNVSLNDTAEMIKKNINTTCGTITVSNEKVILRNGTDTKTYAIDRIWFPKTGNERIKYGIIFGGIAVLIGIVILVRFKVVKKEDKK